MVNYEKYQNVKKNLYILSSSHDSCAIFQPKNVSLISSMNQLIQFIKPLWIP